MRDKPVVVLTVPFGAAHRRTAEALARAWGNKPRPTGMRVVPLEDYAPPVLVAALVRGYMFTISRIPGLFRAAYRAGAAPGRSEGVLRAAVKAATPLGRRLRDLLGGTPGLWVSTHPLASILARSAAPSCPLTVLVTDHHFHPFWCMPGAGAYFVGRQEMVNALVRRGVPRERVFLTGIPIDEAFARPSSRAQAERRLGLDPTPLRILVMGGGLGLGPLEKVVRELEGLSIPHQTVVVTGTNRRLFRKLCGRNGAVVLGYTDRIPELMAASDLCITKPGGLTLAEAAAMGLPAILVDPLPGHEEANSEVLTRDGAASRLSHVSQVASTVERLWATPGALPLMSGRAAGFGRPQAASSVAQIVEDLWLQTNTAHPSS